MPAFTIIIPVYNVAQYLRVCLDSVVKQNYSDWECICIDDASTDGSGAILDEYSDKDCRFVVIHKTHEGVGCARNSGLSIARGAWICFLDADDVVSPGLLLCLHWVIETVPKVELIHYGFKYFQDGERPLLDDFERDNEITPIKVDIRKRVPYNLFFETLFWGFSYRKDVIANVRFPAYKRGEDRVFINTIQLYYASMILCVNLSLYGYRQRPGSAMHVVPSVEMLKDEISHRLDMIALVDASSKDVAYGNCYWATTYFIDLITDEIILRQSEEKRVLWNHLKSAAVRLRIASQIPSYLKFVISLSVKVDSARLAVVLWNFPRWYISHSLLCKLLRLTLRIVKRIGGVSV